MGRPAANLELVFLSATLLLAAAFPSPALGASPGQACDLGFRELGKNEGYKAARGDNEVGGRLHEFGLSLGSAGSTDPGTLALLDFDPESLDALPWES